MGMGMCCIFYLLPSELLYWNGKEEKREERTETVSGSGSGSGGRS